MSIEIMNAVWRESKSTGRARLLLLCIADHQGELGAWPSIKRLSEMVNASERSVQRDIQLLEKLGELRVELRSAPTRGRYKANRYWVNLPSTQEVTNPKDEMTDEAEEVTDSDVEVTAGGVLTITKPLLEPAHSPQRELFNEFWNEYPRKEGKKPAFKAFRSALTRATFEDILAGVIAYKQSDRVRRGYIKLPASWLNEDLWEDAATIVQATQVGDERKVKEKQFTDSFLAEMQELEKQAAPAPKCPHGNNIALCRVCLR
jgi:hypothetical protein